ncbi:flagellar FlbD family protein [Haloimpatiens sp. FM7330]|uniref:flagellar FlbD family protein n=1 Tax=Haloimpatiens sp. FM7330 TaxID=3298610 RepID=UPI00363B8C6D
MVKLTKMNHKEFILNAEHIEQIEEVPETLITLTNGKKVIVLESVDFVVNEVLEYKRKIHGKNL